MATVMVGPAPSIRATSWARLPGVTQAVAMPMAPVAARLRWQTLGVK